MESKALRIAKAYEALLEGAGKPADVTVHRSRYLPLKDDQLPAIVVYLVEDDGEFAHLAGDEDHELTLVAECRAKGDPPDDALDPLRNWAIEAMGEDRTLGGIGREIAPPKTMWAGESFQVVFGACAVMWKVKYETPGFEPAAE